MNCITIAARAHAFPASAASVLRAAVEAGATAGVQCNAERIVINGDRRGLDMLAADLDLARDVAGERVVGFVDNESLRRTSWDDHLRAAEVGAELLRERGVPAVGHYGLGTGRYEAERMDQVIRAGAYSCLSGSFYLRARDGDDVRAERMGLDATAAAERRVGHAPYISPLRAGSGAVLPGPVMAAVAAVVQANAAACVVWVDCAADLVHGDGAVAEATASMLALVMGRSVA